MVTYPATVMRDDDAVFKALSDPTRRALLDALFTRDGRSVQSLCEEVPTMTRFGVMKHLDVLAQAGLVTTRRDGRNKLHFLNPIPIQDLADRWIGKYARPFAHALVDLRDELEGTA
jgi:DNA-binding transcriptional ArsR family regulator